jgi:hypothetical protein
MVNPKYLKGLKPKEKKEKKENIKKSKALYEKGKKEEAAKLAEKRPTIKQGKRSTYTEQIKKKFPGIKPLTKDFENKTGVPLAAQREIVDRGKAAFITSGSRPSVSSPTQWATARLYAFYIKGIKGTLNFDLDIKRKYKIKFKK